MIKFGVAGNSNSFYTEGNDKTLQAASWCKKRGIDAFEYSFGRGVNLSTATAEEIGREFALNGVGLTAHAPYYINFANVDDTQIAKSVMYVIQSAKKVLSMNGSRVVFHVASQGKTERNEAVKICTENLKRLTETIYEENCADLTFCPEAMGKLGQIGTVDEIISFCNIDKIFYPCMDFGHINAREGGILKTSADYEIIIKKLLDSLPECKVENMHIHFSKIQYGACGEIRHLTFEDTLYGPEFAPLAEVLIKYSLSPVIICESDGTQAEDAVEMKRIYNSLIQNVR